jgi:hypothetical protein
MLHKDYAARVQLQKNLIVILKGRQDELIGGKPSVIK